MRRLLLLLCMLAAGFPAAGASMGRTSNSTVWVNGVCLGTWPYGYSSSSYDLTPSTITFQAE